MREIHRWPDAYALDAARMNLKKGAKRWLRARTNDIKTWEDFKTAFRKTFVGKENLTVRSQRMIDRVKKKDEKTSTYFHEKYDLCQHIKLGFDETKEQILTGLWSRDTANALMGKEHNDEDDFLHGILRVERMNNLRKERIGGAKDTKKSTSEGASSKQQPKNESKNKPTNEKQTTVRASRKDEDGKYVCYNCGGSGHLSRDCTAPKQTVCYRCKKTGHLLRECKEPAPDRGSGQGQVKQIAGMPKSGVAKYLKIAQVGGCDMSAFIDTGSSEYTIKATTTIMNGFEIHHGKMELQAFGPAEFRLVLPGGYPRRH